MTDWLTLALLALTGLISSAVTAATAVGGGGMMIAVLLLFMAPAQAIPFQGMVQLVGNFSRIALLRRHIAWPIVWRVGLLMPPGAWVGLWLFRGLPRHGIELLIGVFVLLTLFSPRLRVFQRRDMPLWGFVPLGFFIGAMAVTVAVVAMFSGPFMLRKDLNRQAINVTMATLAALGHITKIVAFGFIGFRPLDHWPEFVVMLPAMVLGTVLGERVLRRMSEALFLWLFRAALAALALKLVLWDGLMPYFN
jgi:uncharacterized membrane protein YfcA